MTLSKALALLRLDWIRRLAPTHERPAFRRRSSSEVRARLARTSQARPQSVRRESER